MSEVLTLLTAGIDECYLRLRTYLKENTFLVLVLISVAIAAYGFELFNLNLTIDEELHAFSTPPSAWISQGRWGMFLLNKFVLPYTVIPFVPLFMALLFNVAAILLMLRAWGVESKLEQMAVGVIGLTYPGMAYMYTFSTINYGIGIGLFCIALSLYIYSKHSGVGRFLAAIPATFSIAIYQGFVVALACGFVVLFISVEVRANRRHIDTASLLLILVIGGLSVVTYILIQVLFSAAVPSSGYIERIFDVAFLRENLGLVLARTQSALWRVYSGDERVYAEEIRVLGVILVLAFVGLGANLLRSRLSIASVVFLGVLSGTILLLPFSVGLFFHGRVATRFLVALPVVLSGLVLLGMGKNPRSFGILIAVLVAYCSFQFIISTNRLFASSHLVLQTDRLLASRIIARIEEAKAEAGTKRLRYMEVVGYLERPATILTPRAGTFGASFFAWGQGDARRILFFLRTVGYQGLRAMRVERRRKMMEVGNAMPVWPEEGSVRVVGDAILIKFGPYSKRQELQIAETVR